MNEQQLKGDGNAQEKSYPATEQEGKSSTKKHIIKRRQFLIITMITGGVTGTGLLIGFNMFGRQNKVGTVLPTAFAPNAWVRIDANTNITIHIAKSEMGQGVMTALAVLLAEEMDADWAKVRVEQAMADKQYGDQKTDGSSSISDSFYTMRSAGAQVRALFVAAAAQTWGVHQSTCRTEKGMVIHIPSGKHLPYGKLIKVASTLTPARLVDAGKLKETEQFTLIGARTPRVDTPHKTNGSATFGIDIRVPGMRYATIARCPTLGGTLESFDSAATKEIAGVLKVLRIKSGIAVIAENTWAAIQGRAALKVNWNAGSNTQLNSTQLRKQLIAEVQNIAPLDGIGKRVEAIYETPFLAHAAMEPMNCTAHVQSNRCEVWVPTQHPQAAQLVAATESGLPLKAVTLHVTFMGGGFGRRVETDFVAEAVQVSQAINAPVQVIWTREDDIQHDFYRPASYQQLSASLTTQGHPDTWTHIVATLDTDRDDHQSEAATDGTDLPYTIAHVHTAGSQISSAIPTGIWRSSNYGNTIFAVESFLDEVAAARGLDPYQMRLQLLSTKPRLQKVLQLAANKAGWGTALPTGRGRGIAICDYFSETAVAEIAEVSVGSDYSVRVHRVVCAVDCGLVINPTIAESQVEGAVVMGLTAALKGEITVAQGQIQQHNFHDYPLLRMNEMPTIEVYFVPSTEQPTGLGEPGLPAITAAVANAIFAATGRRIRRLPIRADDLR